MNLWIEIARDELLEVIARVDCLILNDEELRQLTGSPNLVAGAQEVLTLGPRVIVAKQGEYGSALITADEFFALPAYPLATVVDPTGAGDTFAGGFVGYIARHLDAGLTSAVLRNAMAYGTSLASYNVEGFGTERVAELGAEAVAGRVEDLVRLRPLRPRVRRADCWLSGSTASGRATSCCFAISGSDSSRPERSSRCRAISR